MGIFAKFPKIPKHSFQNINFKYIFLYFTCNSLLCSKMFVVVTLLIQYVPTNNIAHKNVSFKKFEFGKTYTLEYQ